MTLEHMLLVGDSNKFLLKKFFTETHWNRLVISASQLNNDRLSCDSQRGTETGIKKEAKKHG